MNQSELEKLLSSRAEDIYQDKKRILLGYIGEYFGVFHSEMNAHECGSSIKVEVDSMVNKRIEERKPEIIKKIKQKEMDKILSSLESVKFLFQQEQ